MANLAAIISLSQWHHHSVKVGCYGSPVLSILSLSHQLFILPYTSPLFDIHYPVCSWYPSTSRLYHSSFHWPFNFNFKNQLYLVFSMSLFGAGLLMSVVRTCSMEFTRGKVRCHFPKPSEVKRIRRHGWHARMSTPAGRRIIMNRILKGRHVLSHWLKPLGLIYELICDYGTGIILTNNEQLLCIQCGTNDPDWQFICLTYQYIPNWQS